MSTVPLDLPLDVWGRIIEQLPWTCRLVCRAFRDRHSTSCTSLKTQWVSRTPSHAASFQRLLARLPSLTALTCEGCEDIKDLTPWFGGAWCERMSTLDLDGFLNVKDVACITAACTRLQALSLCNFHNLVDLAPLGKCGRLTALDLSGCLNITSIGPLDACPLLTTLSLGTCAQLHDISPLSSCTRLSSLQLTSAPRPPREEPFSLPPSSSRTLAYLLSSDPYCPNVGVLERCVALASLSVRGVRDLRPLATLQLTSLSLTSCERISSLEPLAACLQLTSLSLRACPQITCLTSLQSCSRLAELALTNHRQLVELSDLAGFSALTCLKLNSCERLYSVAALTSCPLLASLILHGCSSLRSLHPLAFCARLTSLDVSSCPSLPEDGLAFGVLMHCPLLTRLDAAEVRVNLAVLSVAARALEHLNLFGCLRLPHIAESNHHLAHFRQLTSLDLGLSDLTDLEPLRLCSRLASLKLRECWGLASLGGAVAALHPTLTALDCSSCNLLNDISVLVHCSRLTMLSLQACVNLRDFAPIAGCTALVMLDLSRCKEVSDVSMLAACQRLQILQLDGCVNLRDVRPLLGCAKLRLLSIDGCWRVVSGVSSLTQAGNVQVQFRFSSCAWRRLVRSVIKMGLNRKVPDA